MCESLNPPQMPSNPPIVLQIIDANENESPPQIIGIKLPAVDPINTPIQIRLFDDMARIILYFLLVVQSSHAYKYSGHNHGRASGYN